MRLLTAVLLGTLLLCACAPAQAPPLGADPMTGCFATGPRKAVEFRVEHQAGQYQLALYQQGRWQPQSEPLRPASPAEVARYFPEDSAQIASGLLGQNGAFGLFRLAQGAALKSRDRNSDFMAQLLIGVGPVYRRSCNRA